MGFSQAWTDLSHPYADFFRYLTRPETEGPAYTGVLRSPPRKSTVDSVSRWVVVSAPIITRISIVARIGVQPLKAELLAKGPVNRAGVFGIVPNRGLRVCRGQFPAECRTSLALTVCARKRPFPIQHGSTSKVANELTASPPSRHIGFLIGGTARRRSPIGCHTSIPPPVAFLETFGFPPFVDDRAVHRQRTWSLSMQLQVEAFGKQGTSVRAVPIRQWARRPWPRRPKRAGIVWSWIPHAGPVKIG